MSTREKQGVVELNGGGCVDTQVSHVFTVLIPGLLILIMLKEKCHADSFRGRGKSISKGLAKMQSWVIA